MCVYTVYVHVYVHVHVYVYIDICVCVRTYVRTYVCWYECMNAWMHECMNAWMYECMNVWMYEWMYECMHACMHACMHVYMNVYDWWMMGMMLFNSWKAYVYSASIILNPHWITSRRGSKKKAQFTAANSDSFASHTSLSSRLGDPPLWETPIGNLESYHFLLIYVHMRKTPNVHGNVWDRHRVKLAIFHIELLDITGRYYLFGLRRHLQPCNWHKNILLALDRWHQKKEEKVCAAPVSGK